MSYCSLDQAKRELNAQTTVDDDRLQAQLSATDGRADEKMGYRAYFEPFIMEHWLEITPDRVDTRRRLLYLDRPLLSLTSMTICDIAVTDVEAYGARAPYDRLRITDSCYNWYNLTCCDCDDAPPLVAKITGLWGMHRNYAAAWWAADTVQNVGGIAAGDATVTVADADGADLEGLTPRFSPGQLLRMGTEYVRVTAVNTLTNVVSINRAENGSTAAAHIQTTPIYIYYADAALRRACARQAAYQLARIGAFTTRRVDGLAEVTYPQDLLPEFASVLQEYWYL